MAKRSRDAPRGAILAFERRAVLRKLLGDEPILTVEDLTRRFGVSAQTIRRDLHDLEASGVVTRAHGGAVATNNLLGHEAAFKIRQAEHAERKSAIAQLAFQYVVPGFTAIMDASTTVLAFAQALPLDIAFGAVVNSLPLALELSRRPNVSLTTIGGNVRGTSLSASGPFAETMLRRIYADVAFISVRGISRARGLTEANPAESSLKEIMLANATRVVALVDSSKLGRTSFSFFAPLDAIDVLVTDSDAPAEIVDDMRAAGIEVRLA